MDQGQRPALNMDLPREVGLAARHGEIDVVKDWLATGGAPDAISSDGHTLLWRASSSSRPSCASVAEILCAAGARDVGGIVGEGGCLGYAAMHGAVDTVRVLLRGQQPGAGLGHQLVVRIFRVEVEQGLDLFGLLVQRRPRLDGAFKGGLLAQQSLGAFLVAPELRGGGLTLQVVYTFLLRDNVKDASEARGFDR